MSKKRLHARHPAIVRRLKRIVDMLEAGRPCLNVAQPLHAGEMAVSQAKNPLIHDRIDNRLEAPVGPLTRARRNSINEFKTITKYL